MATKNIVEKFIQNGVEYEVPTKTSDLTNDSGFITNSYHDSSKQDTLESGTNIKTVNGNSLLGSGDIEIEGGIQSSNNTYDNIIHLSQSEFDNLGTYDSETLYSTPDGEAGSFVDNTAFGPSWDGVTDKAPSMNAIYDKVSTMAEVPSGGTEGQVLTKGASGFGWADAAGGGDFTLLATLARRGSETLSITGYKAILFVATYRYGSGRSYYASSATIPTEVINTITQGGGTLQVEMKKLYNDNTSAYVNISSSLVFSNNSSADPIYVYGIS